MTFLHTMRQRVFAAVGSIIPSRERRRQWQRHARTGTSDGCVDSELGASRAAMLGATIVSLVTFVTGILASVFGPQMAIGGMALILLLLTTWIALFVPRLRNPD